MTGPPDQCFAAFLAFLPLCLALPAPFLVLPLIDFAPCLAFLATPMADSCVLGKGPANPGIGGARSWISALTRPTGGCHLPRWMLCKPCGYCCQGANHRIGWAGLSDLGRSDLANHVGGQAAEQLRGDVPGTAAGQAG